MTSTRPPTWWWRQGSAACPSSLTTPDRRNTRGRRVIPRTSERKRFEGQDVLVVGFGNSAGEIALDLIEHGAHVQISVRSPTVVVRRDVLGIPVLAVATWLSALRPRLADSLSKPLPSLLVGDISKVGLPVADVGPMELIATQGRIPLLDIGTMEALLDGRISVRPGIESFTTTGVRFTDGSNGDFHAVVFGTGFAPAVDRVLRDTNGLLDEKGRPLASGEPTGVEGLYFCGFREVATGRLRRIGVEARRVADLITEESTASARPA